MNNVNFEKELAQIIQKTDYSNEPATKLYNVLRELRVFTNSSQYSATAFKEQVKAKFGKFDFKNFAESACNFKKMLLASAFSKDLSIETIDELLAMTKPIMESIQRSQAIGELSRKWISKLETDNFSE